MSLIKKLFILTISALSFIVTSCLGQGKLEPNLIFVSKGWPDKKEVAAKGFKISPYEAFSTVAKNKKLSLKHKWICYRDNDFYYIADSFGKKITSTNIRKYSVRVDGESGAIR